MGLKSFSSPNELPNTISREATPAARYAEPLRPDPEPASVAAVAIVAKADDLEVIKKAIDDAAGVSGGLWLSYVSILLYLAIAAGAVTHADLFLERTVKLPFLNIELPLLAFFFLAPILFLIVHAYTLVHLVMLTDKAKQYDAVLRRQIDDANSAIRDSLRRQLPINIFIQFLAGPANIRRSALGWLLQAIAWVTLVIAPILLLLLMEIQFLPFHNGTITLAHRVVLVADLILVWWLWGTIISGRPVDDRRRRIVSARSALGALCTCVVLFAWTAATFPGEWLEDHLPDWRTLPRERRLGTSDQSIPPRFTFQPSGEQHNSPAQQYFLKYPRLAQLQHL